MSIRLIWCSDIFFPWFGVITIADRVKVSRNIVDRVTVGKWLSFMVFVFTIEFLTWFSSCVVTPNKRIFRLFSDNVLYSVSDCNLMKLD